VSWRELSPSLDPSLASPPPFRSPPSLAPSVSAPSLAPSQRQLLRDLARGPAALSSDEGRRTPRLKYPLLIRVRGRARCASSTAAGACRLRRPRPPAVRGRRGACRLRRPRRVRARVGCAVLDLCGGRVGCCGCGCGCGAALPSTGVGDGCWRVSADACDALRPAPSGGRCVSGIGCASFAPIDKTRFHQDALDA